MSELNGDDHLVIFGEGHVVRSGVTFGPKVEAPGLGLVATAPTEDWYRSAAIQVAMSQPTLDAPVVTRLKNTIEGLQVQRANLLNERDELRGELAELRRVRNSSNERMADLAAQLDTAWGEIARLTKGLA